MNTIKRRMVIPRAAGSKNGDRRTDRQPLPPRVSCAVQHVAPARLGERPAAAVNLICACYSKPSTPMSSMVVRASRISTRALPTRRCITHSDVISSDPTLEHADSWHSAISRRETGSMRSECPEKQGNHSRNRVLELLRPGIRTPSLVPDLATGAQSATG